MVNNKFIASQWFFFLIGIFTLQTTNSFAQTGEGGIPPSFQYEKTLRSNQAKTNVPITFNRKDLKMVDEWQAGQGAPLSIGILIETAYNPDNSGAWSTLPSGEKIWQLNLRAKGAIALMLYYADFYIPQGGKLFIYNAEKTQILGAYTQRTHTSGGRFATEFVVGDELTLEYVAPPGNPETPRIEIEAVGYGYNNLYADKNSISLRASGTCEVNINCEEGDAWQNQKKGVCYMTQKIGGRIYLCSGSLVNNTAQDLKPYILTAQHCASADGLVATAEDMKQWTFYFHMEREGCDNQSKPLIPKTKVGCRKIVTTETDKESDGLLLLINDPIPENYNVYYNGWDRQDKPAQSGVGIHHPSGDMKKISTFNNPVVHYTFDSDEGIVGDKNAHWNATFDATLNGHGITEGGSSGSPLFNENKLIVGTLTGGSSTCHYTDGLNLYGKLSYHWDKYKTSDSSRMDKWLDPTHSGTELLAGRYYQPQISEPRNLHASYQNQTVKLTWEAPATGKPVKYYVYRNNKRMGQTTTASYTDASPEPGTPVYSVSAVSEDGNESNFSNATVFIGEYKAPVNVLAKQTTSRRITVFWEPPVYEQTIYWGASNAMYQINMDDTKPFYFGQLWSKDDMKPFHKKTLTAVKFIAVKNNTYEVYIVQGKRTYKQEIKNPAVGKTNTIQLTTPFVIDGSESLIVSFYVSKLSANADEYPAACDAGPAIQGKGNIYSYDGQTWENLYDENEPDDFNYNFFVAAIVSSSEGTIPAPSKRSVQQKTNALKSAKPAIRIAPLSVASTASLRSIVPSDFPEITGYTIYRDSVKLTTIPSSATRYIDSETPGKNYYQVSALYGDYESDWSEPVEVSALTAIDPNEIWLYPTLFTSQVNLNGFEYVVKVEVYTASGQLCLRVENPDKVIHMASFAPGMYYFRIYTENNDKFKVLRGIKSKR